MRYKPSTNFSVGSVPQWCALALIEEHISAPVHFGKEPGSREPRVAQHMYDPSWEKSPTA